MYAGVMRRLREAEEEGGGSKMRRAREKSESFNRP